MATLVFGLEGALHGLPVHGGSLTLLGTDHVFPFPWPGGSQVFYVNKAWDSVAGDWVFWKTLGRDVNGVYYPGPGTFGVHTSNVRAQGTSFVDLDAG